MIYVNFNNRNLDITDSFLNGNFFVNNDLFEKEKAIKYLNILNDDNLKAGIAATNGFYSAVVNNNKRTLIIVDKVRTHPIFYYYSEGSLYVSDNAYWVLDKIPNKHLGREEVDEFLSCGFVNGANTLVNNLKQLRAGEYLYYDKNSGVIKLNRYFKYDRVESKSYDYEAFNKKLMSVLDDATKRMLKVVGESTIYLPLSSGLDSRLIALMLKRHGVQNVITYTYGRLNNEESKISKEIADKLGFDWHFIEYSLEKWKKWYGTEECEEFMKKAHSLVSTPHLQDWPAIYEMKKEGLIGEDAIFIPGHTGDFLAGSFIPTDFNDANKEVDEDTVIKLLLDRHYSFRAHYNKTHRLYKLFKEKIMNEFTNVFHGDVKSGTELTEKWVWQERQGKFITNSLRTYEEFGYRWTMLFWDSEVIDFFLTLKLEDRYEKKLYTEFVEKLSKKYLGNEYKKVKTIVSSSGKSTRDILNKIGLIDIARNINALKKKKNYAREFKSQPLHMYGIMTEEEFKKRYNGWKGINSFIAEDALEIAKRAIK